MTLEGWSNLNYVTIAIEDTEERVHANQREDESRAQLDVLQHQVSELIKARDTATQSPELLSEVQSLKETIEAHSKQLEQSTEKLSQLEAENLILRDKPYVPLAASEKDSELKSHLCNLWILPSTKKTEPSVLAPLMGTRKPRGEAVKKTRTQIHLDSNSEM